MTRRALPVAALVLAALTAAAYGALSQGATFLYDDEALVQDEPVPRSLGDVARAFVEPHYAGLPYYRPITRATYLIQKALHADAPAPYHAFNAVLSGLLFLAAYGLLRAPVLSIRPVPALLAVVLVVAHPIASSCVYPIAGRDTLVPAVLICVSAAAFLRPGRAYAGIALAAAAAALAAKEQAVALPAMLALAACLGLAPFPNTRRAWLLHFGPLAVLLGAYLLVRSRILAGSAVRVALFDHPARPFESLAYGVQSVFCPFRDLVYEPSSAAWHSPLRLAIAVLLAAALAGAALKATGGSRTLAFWAGWFVLAQLPTAGIFEQETAFDERYVLIGLLGLVAVGATAASAGWERRSARAATWAVGLFALVWLGSITVHRAAVFRDGLAFHEQWVRTDAGSANAHNGLGQALARSGHTEEAANEYQEALRLRPAYEQAHNNLGVALDLLGQTAEAQRQLEEAIRLKPGYAEARYNLANLLARKGSRAPAEDEYRRALALRPAYPHALNNYGALLVSQGRLDEALVQFERVLRLQPGVRALVNVGVVLGRMGRLSEAAARYRQALRIDPRDADAHFNLAGLSAAQGDGQAAAEHFRQALAARPDWPAALAGLAALPAEK